MEETIKEKLDGITSALDDIQKLYGIFDSIKDQTLPLIGFNLEIGTSIIRQRINKAGRYFKTVSSLSYSPKSENYGRANIPGHPMFYGCTFAMDTNAPFPRIIALMETSNFAIDETTSGVERSTCGKWEVIRPLKLLAFPFFENYVNPIQDILTIQKKWNEKIKDAKISKDAYDIVEYMSSEISKKSVQAEDYFKIANFVYYLLYIKNDTKHLDGIIYPSIKAEGEGYNIALKPRSVDTKLKFVAALLCYLVKNEKKSHLDNVKHSVSISEDGMISYETEKDYDENAYKKLRFIN